MVTRVNLKRKNKKNEKNTTQEQNEKNTTQNTLKEISIEDLNYKKKLILENLHKRLTDFFDKIPRNILDLPVLSVHHSYEGDCKLVDNNKKLKRESTVSLTFGEEFTFDGKVFLDSKGKIKNNSLDTNLKELLINAKKIADKMGKDMSVFIE